MKAEELGGMGGVVGTGEGGKGRNVKEGVRIEEQKRGTRVEGGG